MSDTEIVRLRADLMAAKKHIHILVAAIDDIDNIGEWIWSKADNKTLLSIYLTEAHHTELTNSMLQARAWLTGEVQP